MSEPTSVAVVHETSPEGGGAPPATVTEPPSAPCGEEIPPTGAGGHPAAAGLTAPEEVEEDPEIEAILGGTPVVLDDGSPAVAGDMTGHGAREAGGDPPPAAGSNNSEPARDSTPGREGDCIPTAPDVDNTPRYLELPVVPDGNPVAPVARPSADDPPRDHSEALWDATAKQELIPVDVGAEAQPPVPLVVAAPPNSPTPGPPARVALDLLPPGGSCNSTKLVPPVGVFADIPTVADTRAEPDVDDDGGRLDDEIAAELAPFLAKLGTAGAGVGISAFTLFTLAFGVRVNVWRTEQEYNVFDLFDHKYWDTSLTNAYFPQHAPYHAISCERRNEGDGIELSLLRDNTGCSMNHWICGIREDSPEASKHAPLLNFGDSDSTTEMFRIYRDKGLRLLETVTDGDCGIDVCNMILGWERTPANRQKIRNRLCEVAFKSQGNRAFIWLMYSQYEIDHHKGLYALEDSFIELMEMHGHQRVEAGHHFDGVGIVELSPHRSGVEVSHHGSGVPAVPHPFDCPAIEVTDEEVEALTWKLHGSFDCPAREVTDEEVEALKWKLHGLLEMTPAHIKETVLLLGDEAMAIIVKQYNGR